MPMNPDRQLFGRMVVNGKTTDLGRAPFRKMLERLYQTYLNSDRGNGRARITIDFSEEANTADLDPLKRLEMEWQPTYDSRDDEVAPGITRGMAADAVTDPIYMRWALVSTDPVKRATVGMDEINAARDEFDSKYPGWRAAGFPPYN